MTSPRPGTPDETAGGWVCSEPFDHTSNLMLLEKATGVPCPDISAWRRQTFGDLTSAFRFDSHPGEPPVMGDTLGWAKDRAGEGGPAVCPRHVFRMYPRPSLVHRRALG